QSFGLLSSILTSGLAAKWKTTSQSLSAFLRLLGRVQSPTTSVALSPCRFVTSCSRFSFEPADRLSKIVTSHPSFTSLSERLEPINPAPPVIKAFKAATTLYRNAFLVYRFRLVPVPLASTLATSLQSFVEFNPK